MFEIISKDAYARLGKLEINGKKITTPNILPVIHPRSQIIEPKVIFREFDIQAIFTNAYVIYKDKSLSEKVLNEGIHKHLNFPGIVATDSGAFQHYMYGIDDLQPENIEKFQELIGSDLAVILDQPVQYDGDDRKTAEFKVKTTIQRALDNVSRRSSSKTKWYGPVHGGPYQDLLKFSAKTMNELDFEIYAIGGVVKLFNDYRFSEIVQSVIIAKKHLAPANPIHLFGAGHPMVFALFTALGCDLFDSAAYFLFAKENRYLTVDGTWHLEDLNEFPCSCPKCRNSSPEDVRNLPIQEKQKFLAEHNLNITLEEFKTIREHIRQQSLWHLVELRCRAHPRLLEAYRFALKLINPGSHFIEDAIFKSKALFYTGPETLRLPVVKRYRKYFNIKYKIPNNVKVIIILPELDTNSESSPQFRKWMDIIDKNKDSDIQREDILVMILNPIFGLIPEDLKHMYPLSQNLFSRILDEDQKSRMKSDIVNFIKREDAKYKKIIFVIPKKYINEYGFELRYDGEHLEETILELQRYDKNIKLLHDLP
ncbi:MAG: tRNA guanosine(15) transglycosylase TgtA [Promethearchaeota archaeon]